MVKINVKHEKGAEALPEREVKRARVEVPMADLHQADLQTQSEAVLETQSETVPESVVERSSRPKQKIKVMQGMSIAERKKANADHKELHKQIKATQNSVDDQTMKEESFDAYRLKNNELFDQARYPREFASNLDNHTAMMDLLPGEIHLRSIESDKVIEKLLEIAGSNAEGPGRHKFNWRMFGMSVGECMRTTPRVSFMLGAVEKEVKEKKKGERTVRKGVKDIEAKMETPDEIEDGAGTEQTKDATELRVRAMEKALNKLPLRNGGTADIIPFLVNPRSFTQTAENFFDFSFLIKRGAYGLSQSEDGLLLVKETDENQAAEAGSHGNQCILSLDMQEWKDLCWAYNLTEKSTLLLPERDMGPNSVYFDPLEEAE